jgi:ATP-binding cassette subfamily B protein
MRFRWVRQNDQSDCGAAALATVALHYKLPISVQRLRDLCGTDRVGTNLLGLVEAARKLGFTARPCKGPYEKLGEIPLPAIAHAVTPEGLGHFVVLYRVGPRGVVIADPARGILKMSADEFRKFWTGYILALTPDETRFVRATPEAAPGPWRRFVGLLRPHRTILVQAFVAALLMTALGLSSGFFVQHLVDSVLIHKASGLLNALAIGMLGILLFRTILGALREYLLIHVSRKVDLGLIAGYMRHVLNLPMGFFESRRVGEILSRVNDAVKVRAAVSGATLTAVVDGTLIALFCAVMFSFDVSLALAACLFVPLMASAVILHHSGIRRHSRRTMEEGAKLEAQLVEDVSAVEAIKSFHLERHRSEAGEQRLVDVVRSVFSLQRLGLSMNAASMAIGGAASIAVLWYGGHRVIEGAISLGQLMFFTTLLGLMIEPLMRLASLNLQIQDALIAVDRLYQVIDLPVEELDATGKATFTRLREGICIQGATFRYGCREEVLRQIDLRIPAGKTTAIVGESGSGKTTLLKLLMRFYDPTQGRILFDGIDARDYRLSSLRSKIGIVSQEPFIFTGTLRENISIARPQASMQEIARAARSAGLEEFINGLPQRYDTVVGERGANLSGGQRQRLAIARALLMEPEILIFDEATSHLDTATERAIQESLRSALAGKTVILVAHRLSTLQMADEIHVLKGGRIVEFGAHSDLLRQEGVYASLWHAQTPEPAVATASRNGHA